MVLTHHQFLYKLMFIVLIKKTRPLPGLYMYKKQLAIMEVQGVPTLTSGRPLWGCSLHDQS